LTSLVDQMLVRPLPYREAERLVLPWEVRPDGGASGYSAG
jgi:hypothetical protein